MLFAKRYLFRKIIVPVVMGTILLVSCKTDIEMVQALADLEKIPSVIAKNVEMLYTEHGAVKIRVEGPEMRFYQFEEEPYNEFPEGIVVSTFTDSLTVNSKLTAKYAIYYENKKLWKAQYDVVAQNAKGEVLNTEQLFWDEENKRIYSHDMVKFTTADGTIFGEGFESDENFDNWVIKKTTGTIFIDDQE